MPYGIDKIINVQMIDENGNVIAEFKGMGGLSLSYESNCDEETINHPFYLKNTQLLRQNSILTAQGQPRIPPYSHRPLKR